jgi:hypothetical protein
MRNAPPIAPLLAPEGDVDAVNNPGRQLSYNLEKGKWENSNRKFLMVIKSSIMESIRGAIPNCKADTEYLQKIENQFTGSTKAYASTLIKKLVTEK